MSRWCLPSIVIKKHTEEPARHSSQEEQKKLKAGSLGMHRGVLSQLVVLSPLQSFHINFPPHLPS